MATTEPGRTTVRTGEARRAHAEETKPFWMTSEFLVLVASVAGVLIAAAMIDEFEARDAWLFVTILAAAYMLARGHAKSGTRHWD